MPDHHLRPFRPGDAAAIHRLHAQHAVADRVDPCSSLEAAHLAEGTAVLAANASAVQPDRAALLERSGYRQEFAMVEMEHDRSGVRPRPLPEGVSVRPATVADARSLAALTTRVWAGRPFFVAPGEEEVRDWLRRSPAPLFQVATAGERVVGLVAVSRTRLAAQIEDVQVDPAFQRRGLATALLARALAGLAEQPGPAEHGGVPVRLHTEAHDPAGARSLYERLGFRVVRVHARYREPLGTGAS